MPNFLQLTSSRLMSLSLSYSLSSSLSHFWLSHLINYRSLVRSHHRCLTKYRCHCPSRTLFFFFHCFLSPALCHYRRYTCRRYYLYRGFNYFLSHSCNYLHLSRRHYRCHTHCSPFWPELGRRVAVAH